MDAKALQELFCDFVKDGEILEKPVGRTGNKNLESRRITLLRQFIDTLLHTDVIHDDSKRYLTTKHISLSEYARQYKSQEKEDTVTQRINRDINKIKRLFNERIIVDIVEYKNNDIGLYEKKLSEVLHKNTNMHLLDEKVALKIPKGGDATKATLEDLDDTIKIIKPYIKAHMQAISNDLNKDAVAYIRKILSSTLLTEEEQEKKQELLVYFGNVIDEQELVEQG